MTQTFRPHVRYGWPVHKDYNGGLDEPLPKSWIDLIRQLGERDRLEAKAGVQPQSSRGASERSNGRTER